MTTSLSTLLTSEIFNDGQLSVGALSYFRARLKSRIHQVVLSLFLERKNEGMNRADLARRLRKAPEQITRWLSSPGNMRLDTISDLLLAMGYELHVEARRITSAPRDNRYHRLAFLSDRKDAQVEVTPTTTARINVARFVRSNKDEIAVVS